MTRRKSKLDLVNETDNFPYYDHHFLSQIQLIYYIFKCSGDSATLGYIRPEVARKLPESPVLSVNHEFKQVSFKPPDMREHEHDAAEYRTMVFAEYLQKVREAEIFEVLKGWRNEMYPVYGSRAKNELLFSMERSASALFGIITYGVHMTAYTESPDGIKIWSPRRADTKQTYPGMMDNTVAGGLSTGEMPSECLLRESMEEASLSEDISRHAKPCGTMTYFHIRDERAGGEVGLCQPECQYIYDLVLPEHIIPRPGDDEAVDFQLLTVQETQEAMAQGKFKPNCALLLIEFFVRHGIITPENEPDYLEIVHRLHRRLEFPMGQAR